MVKYKKNMADYIFNAVNYFILLVVGLITVLPFYYILMGSFSPITDIVGGKLILWPSKFTIEAYRLTLNTNIIPDAYKVTLFISVVGTLISMVLTVVGAYVLSKRYLPGRNIMTLFIVITMLFNGGLIPFYLTVNSVGLMNSVWALIIPSCISSYNMIVMRNFFQGIPNSLEESAVIDGCSQMGVLTKIILPISKPVLATIALFYMVGYWNSFFQAIIFISDQKLWPLQLVLRQVLLQSQVENLLLDNRGALPTETIKMAMIIITVLPILFVYPFLQKYFVKGLLIGSVKG